MIKDFIIFLLGVHLGQEYGAVLPSVKNKSISIYNAFITSDFYKKLKDDFSKKEN
jgi:hypothetical protein